MKPILRDLPDTLETARLVIRSPRPGDGPAVNAGVRESIDSLRPWMPWADHVPTVEESEEYVREAYAKYLLRSEMQLLLFLKTTGELVGSSGLHRIDWHVPKFEIGYWLGRRYEGQGLMTEAVEGIAAFAFDTLGARRVEIRCDSLNTRSAAIPTRLGFTLEGILRNNDLDVAGNPRDTMVFAKVR